MIALALKRPVTIAMAVCLVLVLGAKGNKNLGRDLLPNIAYPSLTVMTRYEGAAPQEVEEFITQRLEASLSTIKGKRQINSYSREGLSLITIEFQWGENMQLAILHVREKLDIARFQAGFPQDAERPTILRWDPSSKPIVSLAITADTSILALRDGVHDVIKPRLEQLDGVALAQISGDVERVIDVEVDPQRIMLYGLDLEEIATAIERSSGTIAGGTIRKGRYRYALRTLGEFSSVAQIEEVVVARRNGAAIRLGDVAEVKDTLKDREALSFVQGKEAVGLLVYKEAGANTIETTRRIKATLQELATTQPAYTVTMVFEEAQFIEQALNNVWVSLIFGGLFAFVVLVLFLGDLKSPFYVFTSIPISIIACVALMYFTGVSVNIMSLGGLALGVGMLVDNSIVVLENIYRHRQEGTPALEAAWIGTREVAAPVAASTFTTVAVFFPIVYLKGITGALFGDQALTVTFSMISSLVVSLTVLPLLTALGPLLSGRDKLPATLPSLVHLDAQQNPRNLWFWRWWEFLLVAMVTAAVLGAMKKSWLHLALALLMVAVLPLLLFLMKWVLTLLVSLSLQSLALLARITTRGSGGILEKIILPPFNKALALFETLYHRLLLWALERSAVALTACLILLLLSLVLLGELKRELMPKSATGQFLVEVQLPPGSAIESTTEIVHRLETLLLQDSAVAVVFSQIGASEANVAQLLRDSGANSAQISVRLKAQNISLSEVRRLAQQLRGATQSWNEVKLQVTESESSFEDLLAAEGGAGFQLILEGTRFEDLFLANDLAMAALGKLDGLKDLKSSLSRDYPQVQVQLNRETIERFGFTLGAVGQFLSGGMRGSQATEYKEFDKRIDVRVRFPASEREDFERVLAMSLTSPDGTVVPLRQLIDAEVVLGSKEIRRQNQKRVAVISAQLAGRKISELVPMAQEALKGIRWPDTVRPPRFGGEHSGVQGSFNQLIWAFVLSALLVYMIMASQFESLRAPFVVIFAVPFGLIGASLALTLAGETLNIMSVIGLVVLSGIVVNDAIVKVDFIKTAHQAGSSVRDAILQAAAVRLRPILMTTATTVLGLLPMAFGLMPWLVNRSFFAGIFHELDPLLLTMGLPPTTELFSGQGAELQRPLAIAVIGGLSAATLLTLVITPLLYAWLMPKQLASPGPKTKERPLENGAQA
jgi:HAE1 family hydrophobic/amphiphilic exporter-1